MPRSKLRDNELVTDSSHCYFEQLDLRSSASRRIEAVTWKASAYDIDSGAVRAAVDASWARYELFASYRPAVGRQDSSAGPHLRFAGLKESLLRHEKEPMRFMQDLYSFVNEYGLLGMFWHDYPAGPVLPAGKEFVAPEAIVDSRGRLRSLDPATEGQDFLSKLQERKERDYGLEVGQLFGRRRASYKAAGRDLVALPSELVVFPQVGASLPEDGSDYRPVPWDEAKQKYGALLVADGRSYAGVSVLYRSEPVSRWKLCLNFFPAPSGYLLDGEVELLDSSNEYLLVHLDLGLKETVSPSPQVGEDGNLEQGWWCRDSLSALHLMIYLDKTGDAEYRRCQAPGCGRLFRTGVYSTRVYCPHPDDPRKPSICGSRVTTQRDRERRRREKADSPHTSEADTT